ncbi:hypothetical protein [Blastococcus mobilis]|uniref:hypothetical protein n=1 Tax=Blastococcus mobilis TaxID=1938746 RepID=UPI001131DD00|nr:hypothetical protein [Blastococcus mobilis]
MTTDSVAEARARTAARLEADIIRSEALSDAFRAVMGTIEGLTEERDEDARRGVTLAAEAVLALSREASAERVRKLELRVLGY